MVDGNALVVDPCQQLDGAMAGKIVLYDLPAGCIPAIPAFLADQAGATGVVIRNTAASGLPDVSAQISNQDVTIPYVGITQAVGNSLRTNIGTANVTIQKSATILNGDNQGRLMMFAPAVFDQGASVSHWAREARPDLLMESSRGNLAFDQVDITPAAMADIGWGVSFPGVNQNLVFEDGFENLPP